MSLYDEDMNDKDQKIIASIIVPVSRNEYYIKNLLKSFLNSNPDYSNFFEVILVTSSPVKLNIKSEFKDINIKVVECARTHPSVKRNAGVKESSGRYLGFIDDDVKIKENWVEELISQLDKNQFDGLTGPQTSIYEDTTNNRFVNFLTTSFLWGFKNTFSNRKDTFVRFTTFPTCNCAVTKKLFEDVGGFNEVAEYHIDDAEFPYIAAKLGYKFFNSSEFESIHAKRKFPFPFLNSVLKGSFFLGYNTLIFPEIMFQYKGILLALLALPLLLFFLFLPTVYQLAILLFGLAMLVLLAVRERKLVILCLPLFMLMHFLRILFFWLGVIYYFYDLKNIAKVRDFKKIRYKKCADDKQIT